MLSYSEGALRVYTSFFNPKATKIVHELGWKHSPNSFKDVRIDGNKFRITYNSRGLRWNEKPYQKNHSKFRVLFLGDSFTDASTVPDDKTFAYLIEKSEPRIESINMGMYGYGTVQEYLTFINEGHEYNPDLVVLMTYENDFYDNSDGVYPWIGPRPKAVINKTGELEFLDIKEPLTKKLFKQDFLYIPYIQYFLLKNSQLYYLIDQYIYKKAKMDITKKLHNYSHMHNDPALIYLYLSIVNKLHYEIKKRNADLIVFLFNSKETITQMENSPMKDIQNRLNEMGIYAVDLFPYIKESLSEGNEIYHKKDPHWNIEGNQLISEIILQYIKSHPSYRSHSFAFSRGVLK